MEWPVTNTCFRSRVGTDTLERIEFAGTGPGRRVFNWASYVKLGIEQELPQTEQLSVKVSA